MVRVFIFEENQKLEVGSEQQGIASATNQWPVPPYVEVIPISIIINYRV